MPREADDNTVRLNVQRVGQRAGRSLAIPVLFGLAVAGLAGIGAWYGASRAVPAAAPAVVAATPVVAVLPPAPPAPAFNPPLTSEADILSDAPDQVAVYRFAQQPNVIVLQFPTLAEQGRMLNRAAALIEKAGFPRDHVLPDAELNSRILAGGDTPATFYYGHDYRAADLRRFFDIAETDGVTLSEGERRLQIMLGKLGWQQRGAIGALISLVRQSDVDGLDAASRATVLRHELSHGLYFTDAAFAEFVHRFWTDTMSARDRELFTAFLVKGGYDPSIEELIVNETQAYLMFTNDTRYFNAAALGMPQERVDMLRREFLAGMPPSWLRDLYTSPAAPVTPARALMPR